MLKLVLISFLLLANTLVFADSRCVLNPEACDDKKLCFWATEVIKDERKWSKANFSRHVSEAENRELSCGIKSNFKELSEAKKIAEAVDSVLSEKNEETNDSQQALTDEEQNAMSSSDQTIEILYWCLHFFIFAFLYLLWNIERSRANNAIKLLEEEGLPYAEDFYGNDKISYGGNVGSFYTIWRFVLRPITILGLITILLYAITNLAFSLIYPISGILLILVLPKLRLVRYLFPVLLLIGYINF